jgi:hypothetical protein
MGSSPDADEISRLKERIRVLEDSNREIPAPSSSYGGGQQGYQQQAPAYGGQPAYQQTPSYGGNPQYRPMDRN